MFNSVTRIPLAEFLAQPNIEASAAWELIDGQAIQKPMPTRTISLRAQTELVQRHSLLLG